MNKQEILVMDTIYNGVLDFFKQKFDKKKASKIAFEFFHYTTPVYLFIDYDDLKIKLTVYRSDLILRQKDGKYLFYDFLQNYCMKKLNCEFFIDDYQCHAGDKEETMIDGIFEKYSYEKVLN